MWWIRGGPWIKSQSTDGHHSCWMTDEHCAGNYHRSFLDHNRRHRWACNWFLEGLLGLEKHCANSAASLWSLTSMLHPFQMVPPHTSQCISPHLRVLFCFLITLQCLPSTSVFWIQESNMPPLFSCLQCLCPPGEEGDSCLASWVGERKRRKAQVKEFDFDLTTLEWKEGGKKSTNWSFSILSCNSRVLRNALPFLNDKIFHSTKNNYRFAIFLRYLGRRKFSSINPHPTPHPPIPCPNTTYTWHNYLSFLWDPAWETRHIRTRNYKVSILSLVSLNALS